VVVEHIPAEVEGKAVVENTVGIHLELVDSLVAEDSLVEDHKLKELVYRIIKNMFKFYACTLHIFLYMK